MQKCKIMQVRDLFAQSPPVNHYYKIVTIISQLCYSRLNKTKHRRTNKVQIPIVFALYKYSLKSYFANSIIIFLSHYAFEM